MLQKLQIKQFRNYEELLIDFDSGFTIVVGNNGEGKTNLLEAVYFLSVLRSFRTTHTRNLVRWGQPGFTLAGKVSTDVGQTLLQVRQESRRVATVNGKNLPRTSEFIQYLFCVPLVPEDMNLIRGAGVCRRRFLDITLSQLSGLYLAALQDYQRALKARNALLQRRQHESTFRSAVEAFDQIMVENAVVLTSQRRQFCAHINRFVAEKSMEIFPGAEPFTVHYESSYPGSDDEGSAPELRTQYVAVLRKNMQRDMKLGATSVGPHRDDFVIRMRQGVLREFGSEGQCRLAALLLKIATAGYVLQHQRNATLIYLVDDVAGDLDNQRRVGFLRQLRDAGQVFLACTSLAMVPDVQPSAVFDVHGGRLTRR